MSEVREFVLTTLRQATSQNIADIKIAENQLQQWEIEPGFYATLVEIFLQHNLEVPIRWMAIVYLKNGVDRYWRSMAPNAIQEKEKATIRSGLLQNLNEPVPQVAIQFAVLMGKLARIDCPKEWPELIPRLIEAIMQGNDIVRHRTLLTLYHVVKQLSSKRLCYDRRVFQNFAATYFNFILELWRTQTQNFITSASDRGSQDSGTVQLLEQSRLVLKILRKLVVHGFKNPHESAEVTSFLRNIFEYLPTMIEYRKQNLENHEVRMLAEKYIVLLMKILHNTLEYHPFSYVDFINPSLNMIMNWVFLKNDQSLLFERFTVLSLNLIRFILVCPEYKATRAGELQPDKNVETYRAYEIKTQFFTKDTLNGICFKLINEYFLLTAADLESWDSDPEAFFLDAEAKDSWKYSIRACTESFFDIIFHSFPAELTPTIMELVKSSAVCTNTRDMLNNDAIYNCVGRIAFDLYEDINFDDWFNTVLLNELRKKDSDYRIIRRRVIWLIGQWHGVQFSSSNRPALIEACIELMGPHEDLVVRLTSAMTLRTIFEEHITENISPYLPTIFKLVFDLLKEVNECETKIMILNIISIIIEVMGYCVQLNAEGFVHYLPGLWEDSAEHNLLRCNILATLVNVVTYCLIDLDSLQEFLIKTVKISTDVNESCHVYLSEDGFLLWLALLENSAQPTAPLLALYENIIPNIEMVSSENLKLCLQVTNTYVLLCPQLFLNQYGTTIVQGYLSIINDLKNDVCREIIKFVDLVLRTIPQEGHILVQPLLPNIVKRVIEESMSFSETSLVFTVISRLLLNTSDVFVWILNKVGLELNKSLDEVTNLILEIWVKRLESIFSEEGRKLCALALAKLCSNPGGPIMNVWTEAVTAIGRVIFDTCDDENPTDVHNTNDESLKYEVDTYGEAVYQRCSSHHYKRMYALAQNDPSNRADLRAYFGQQIHLFYTKADPAVSQSFCERLDKDTKTLLKGLVALPELQILLDKL